MEKELEELGYKPTDTGGGVMAYVKQESPDRYLLITNNGKLPEKDQPATIGLYDDNGYPEWKKKYQTLQQLISHIRQREASE